LVRVDDGMQLWAEAFDRELKDVLTLQREVARAVARGIQLTLTPQVQARLENPVALDPEAYELYLRGRYFWNKRDAPNLQRAIVYFDRALARRPDHALSHVGLADAYIVLGDQGHLPPAEAMPKAEAAARRALELDASSAEAQTSLAMVKAIYKWDWSGADQDFRRAMDLNPSYATAHHWYAHLLRAAGRFDEAVAETRLALSLDPLSLIINSNAASALFYAGRYDEAARQYRKTLEMDPRWAPAHWGLGRTLLAQGYVAEALAEHEKAAELAKRDAGYLATLAHAYASAGRLEEARRLLAEIDEQAKTRYVAFYDRALVAAGFGDRDAALALLEKACAARESSLRQLRVDERLAALRSESRFQDLARRVGLLPWPMVPASPRLSPS
jgi:tetratricopeptide (TPR) repeat protein